MITDKLKDNTILILKSNTKNKIIEEIREKSFLNIKFMTLKELREQLSFKYDEKTIYYLINKYHYNYDVAIKYLNNLYYIEDKDYNDKKIKKLIDLKEELIKENLLYYNNLFKSSIKNRNIIIYNHYFLSKFDLKLINKLKNITNVDIYNEEKEEYHHQTIYEFNTLEEEVSYVASNICKLINDGIDINNIKLCGINDEYTTTIKRIFKFFKIPISFNNSNLYATKIASDFLKNMTTNIEETLNYIKDNYNLTDENICTIYNSIINTINKYAWCDNILNAKEMIIHDFKQKTINTNNYVNEIKIINTTEEASDNDYVFLMSFNQGIIPKTTKDEDYLNNHQKDLLEIDNTNDINKINREEWLYNIKHCKNLIITCKKTSHTGEFYLSSLNDELKLEIQTPEQNYTYSNMYNKIELTKSIDTLIKYNTKSKNLELLYNNYKDLDYMTYNNQYNKIDKNKLKKLINNQLILSYSALNNYYHCAFKYYLSNILKLNIYEETFYTIIGNLFHYILSICFQKDINIESEYNKFINKQTYKFNAKELFFLNNLLEELKFVISTIKKQYEYSSLENSLYEEKIEVDKSIDNMKIIFKGFIDKIMLDSQNKVAAIIDYKTGNPDLNLNNSIYGLDLQLPVYIYLTKQKFPNIRIVGFYLQKILNSEISIDNKHTYNELKEDKLKLQGYTNSDESLINIFDSGYQASKVIKGMRTSSKGIATKKVLDDVKIDKLNNLTEKKIDEAIESILNANFDINPKKVGMNNLGCNYCTYKDICFMTEKDLINLKEHKNLDFLEEN